ncbi:kinesin family member 11, partial [Clonorchis sinensis]
PLNKQEQEKGALSCVTCSRDKITVKDRSTSKVFTFDHVFHPFVKQIEVYNAMVKPVVEEILMGYNCTIFAYGQTGSGKTFTMTGERSDKLRYAWESDPLVGIIPRALSHLFETLQQTVCFSDFSVRVSFLEVYNEELFDLLSVTEANRLTIYDDVNRKGSVIVKGLREIVVLDKDNVHAVIERGLARRQTASTLLNAQSSRSHSIFTVTVHIKESNPVTGEELLRIGKLHLVDLAGSESIGRSGAVDKRAREAGSINQSLLTLGRVITALVDRTPHVPYRESKLTRLLQDSLGGKTKTSIIATISPSSLCLDETLSTLDYAHRAKNIENRPEVNVRLNKTDLVRSYNEELERLRRDLEAARTKTGIYVDMENYQNLQTQIKQQRERICELEERREILEHDLAQIQEDFTLTQAELTEARERQEQIESELVACQKDVEEKRVRLLKLKCRLEEEAHIREKHQETENVLRGQAATLLQTARSAISDVTGLHDKVHRLASLDEDNRERVSNISTNWAVDRMTEPISQVADLSKKFDLFCQSIRNALSDLRTNNEAVTVQLLDKQQIMKQTLAACLAKECIHAAEQTDLFANEQLNLSKECLETTLRPQAERIRTLYLTLQNEHHQMTQLIQSHNAALRESHAHLDKLIADVAQLVKMCNTFAAAQQERNSELGKLWDNHYKKQKDFANDRILETFCSHYSKKPSFRSLMMAFTFALDFIYLINREFSVYCGRVIIPNRSMRSQAPISELYQPNNTIRSALSSLENDQETTYDHVVTTTAVMQTQLNDWHQTHVQELNKLEHMLSSSNKSAATRLDTFELDGHNQLEQLDHTLSCVIAEHETLQTKADTCLDRLCKQAVSFSTHGLGAELRQRAQRWKDPDTESQNGHVEHASIQLDSLVLTTAKEVADLSQITSGKALMVENLSGDTSYQASIAFKKLKENLEDVPADFGQQLSENLHRYTPTGQTPQPKSFTYPEQLAQTAPHMQLRRAFRVVQQQQGLQEASLTPLPLDKSLEAVSECAVSPTELQQELCVLPSVSPYLSLLNFIVDEIMRRMPEDIENPGVQLVANESLVNLEYLDHMFLILKDEGNSQTLLNTLISIMPSLDIHLASTKYRVIQDVQSLNMSLAIQGKAPGVVSDEESASTFSGVLKEQNTPIRGRIFRTQSLMHKLHLSLSSNTIGSDITSPYNVEKEWIPRKLSQTPVPGRYLSDVQNKMVRGNHWDKYFRITSLSWMRSLITIKRCNALYNEDIVAEHTTFPAVAET